VRRASKGPAAVSITKTPASLLGVRIRGVMRGLDPRIHRSSKKMDCRIKSGNDESKSPAFPPGFRIL
jgi:hypothetical protein